MSSLNIAPATVDDLPAINQIISDCVMGWNLPDRVKRLSLSSYHYNEDDLAHQEIFKAVRNDEYDESVVGVVALEAVNQSDSLLHGLYVKPEAQFGGVGKRLVDHALQRLSDQKRQGMMVKAQPDANAFFDKTGFSRLPVVNQQTDYPHRWWKEVG